MRALLLFILLISSYRLGAQTELNADTVIKADSTKSPVADSSNGHSESARIPWPWIVGLVISFFSGGLAGAIYTRRQTVKDRENERKLPKLTLKTVQERATLGSTSIHKEFELINNTSKDVDSCEIVFEFDQGALVVQSETRCHQGVNQLERTLAEDNKHGYQITQLNREEKIVFTFSIDRFTENRCRAHINCKGFGLVCIDRNVVDLPSIQPNRFEAF